jgi:hypothetical protein
MKTFVKILMMTIALTACSEGGEQSAPAAEVEHAAPGVEPGSYEDWCGEHEVPESLCTRCNPALIPAFQATGDWCAEHGMPESQCRACNPDLRIERPARRGG